MTPQPQTGLGFPLPNIAAKIPPQFQRPFQAFVIACKRVMYDPKSHYLMQRQLARPAPMPQKLAQGVAGLVMLVYVKAKDSGDNVPLPVLIPAAIELVGEAAQFITQTMKTPIDQPTYKAAVALVIAILSKSLGISQQVNQAIQRRSGAPATGAPSRPAPASAPTAPTAPAVQPFAGATA